jgi:hypothetical protein
LFDRTTVQDLETSEEVMAAPLSRATTALRQMWGPHRSDRRELGAAGIDYQLFSTSSHQMALLAC